MDIKILKKTQEPGFYYFALINNFESIIRNGILCKNLILKEQINYLDFSNQSVQSRRRFVTFQGLEKEINLHDFVPLYYVPKTPTLSAVRDLQNSIFFIKINRRIIFKNEKLTLFTDGNAASDGTSFFSDREEANKNISWEVINAPFWTDYEDGKRKRSSEVLIYEMVEPIYFDRIVVNNEELFNYVKEKLIQSKGKGLNKDLVFEVNQNYFF